MEYLPIIVALILFALGILGTFLPIMPGSILILLGIVIYGVMTDFENLSLGFYMLQTLAAILVIATDYITSALGVKKFNGSNASIWGASVGVFAGIFLLGPIGLVLGPFLGAYLGELLAGKTVKNAVTASIGALVGLLGGIIVKLSIEIAMITWFFIIIF
ncbi:hypothetical protein GGQ84_001702 [Desulfitispora alkaliphila]|uniref:DUF456 domain-containing protein n=1 Tax=Desulfitispora alkaliphila TaxID=622674 RepID=UPI003D19E046